MESRKRELRRKHANKTLKPEKPFTQPGPSGPIKPTKTPLVTFKDSSIAICQKHMSIEAARKHCEELAARKKLIELQDAERQKAREIGFAIMEEI